jgi:hypothetical protein
VASPILLPPAFDGMAQDFPRNNLPKGKAWNFVDFILESLGAPATERGGWTYAADPFTGVDGSATYAKAVLHAPFNAGAQLLVIDDNNKLIKIVSGANFLIAGTPGIPVQNPFMHQQLVVIPSPNGSTAPQKYDGATLAALGASAPAGKFGCVFINYTWLGGSSANPQRGYASDVGDPTTFVTVGVSASYLDVSFPIRGMAALPNVMLWFGDERTARIRGTTPPPDTDMQIDDPVFNYGTTDARSIAVNGSVACFANDQGVFLTNGTSFPEDLTKSCGVSKFWRDLCTGRTSSWTIAGGWFGSNYIVSVMNGSTFVDCILFDTAKRSASRISNLKSMAFTEAGSAGQELYAGSRATANVMKLSTMWTPGSSYKNDADGAAVLGTWESPFFDTQKIGSQRWRDLYLMHDLRDAASDVPIWTVAYCVSPEAGAAYTTLSRTAAATTKKTTVRIPVAHKGRGLGFKLTRTNAASFARLYGLGATVYSREGSRLD